MISSEVQRTLVKSPPELWAELSDPQALSRHLGELGEIRIICTEPESKVEWETEGASGTVLIKPSGWGTNVTLSVIRDIATPQQAAPQQAAPERAVEPQPSVEPQPPVAEEPAPQGEADPTFEADVSFVAAWDAEPDELPETEPESTPVREASATAQHGMTAQPEAHVEPRVGFFSRLFGRRRRPERAIQPGPPEEAPTAQPPLASLRESTAAEPSTEQPEKTAALEQSPEPTDAFATLKRALTPESVAAADPFAAHSPVRPAPEATEIERETQAERTDDISAELRAVEEVAAEEVAALLTAVLDSLGAAHHRPFSRS